MLARNRDGRLRREFTTRKGMGFVTIRSSGAWTIEVHRAIALEDDPEAEWEIHSTTLRFDVPADGREGREDR